MTADETDLPMVTDDSFGPDVIAAPGPVLVDFWASWCGPSRLVTPVLQRVVRERGDKVKVVRIDVDSNPASRSRYHVSGLPAQLLFEGGVVHLRIEGERTFNYSILEKMIDIHC